VWESRLIRDRRSSIPASAHRRHSP
jgi:hypothetical protein